MTSESVIRRMTRLANKHGAVNLSQGFTDEPPPFPLIWGAVVALLGGNRDQVDRINETKPNDFDDPSALLQEQLVQLQGSYDEFNQYSYPFGIPELRNAIASYTHRWTGRQVNPESEITVALGSTEGLASVLAALGTPGDGIVIFEPFHEMYPSQAELFGLTPRPVTLRENKAHSRWGFDPDELRQTAKKARFLILNSPHNPTGMVFGAAELEIIAEIALAYDLIVIADEIYEHIIFDGIRNLSISTLPSMTERTIILNSISKTANATGWRVGWIISPERFTERIRAVHDTLVIQAPTPLQQATVCLLSEPDSYFLTLGSHFARKRKLLTQALSSVGFRFVLPQGAYYLFTNFTNVSALQTLCPMDAAMHLIEQIGVATVPGDNFYAKSNDGDQYLRFAFCRNLETLTAATERLQVLAGRPK
jgi:aspartate/methionine/tyrosine aminotransferase|tara:strand:+ start:197 stop:1462 length:1266 start_codon:yes stop_codon:yes gene_type:complete